MEGFWAEFRSNTETIEGTRDWVGTDEYIEANLNVHELYMKALQKVIQLLPQDNDIIQQSMANQTMFRQVNSSTASSYSDPNNGEEPSHSNDEHNQNHMNTSNTENSNVRNFLQASTPRTIGLPANIKLPPLQIKPFSGKMIDWPEFKATCESTFTAIMDDTCKFRYLKCHLTDEPARKIKHLPLAPGSYDRAWEILKKSYDNE